MAQRYSFANPLHYDSPAINKYLEALSTMAENTQKTAKDRMSLLPSFAKEKFNSSTIDQILTEIKSGKLDKYDVLSSYASFIKSKKKSDNRIRALVKAARQFFEHQRIEFSDKQFKIQVRLPRAIKRQKQPIGIKAIREILLACPDIKLKTFIMLLASTGMRPIELCSILHRHINLDSDPATITIRAEHTKMRSERYVYLTRESAKQVKEFLDYKLRERWQPVKGKNGEYHDIKIKPVLRQDDILFAPFRRDDNYSMPKIQSIYTQLLQRTEELLDSIGKGERIAPNKQRVITFYSLRRFAFSTISGLGHEQFAHWIIGHLGSEYFEKSEAEKVALFKSLEANLMFLDVNAIERRDASINAELERQQQINLTLQEHMAKMQKDNETFKKQVLEALKRRNPKARILKQDAHKHVTIEES